MRSLRGQMRLREGDQTQGRGIEPRPMEEVGHSTGRGSQWCNRLPAMPPRDKGGERGYAWSVYAFWLLHEAMSPKAMAKRL